MERPITVGSGKTVLSFRAERWSTFGFVYAAVSNGDAYGTVSSGALLLIYFGASMGCSTYLAYRRANRVGGPFDATFADLLRNLAILVWLLILARVEPMSTVLGPMLIATVFGILIYCIIHSLVYGKRLWKVRERMTAGLHGQAGEHR